MQADSSPAAGRGPFLPDVARIALGVFIGGLAALFAHDAIVGQRPPPPAATPAVQTPPRPVGDDSTSSGTPSTQAAPPPMVAQPAPPPAPPAPEPAPPAPAQTAAPQVEAPQPTAPVQDAGQKKADDELKTAQALAARLESERQQRRADAWARYFQPSPVCRADPATGACADAHLAARKRFDAQYVDR